MSIIDQPISVRKGEELDELRLRGHLAQHLDEFDDNQTIEIEQFPGGHSNLTYLLTQGDQEFVLRKAPIGSTVKSAHDMSREYNVLSKLGPEYSKAPTPVYLCEKESILGSSFYLVERIRGLILRKDFPDTLAHSAEDHRQMCHSLINTLSELHQFDYEKLGLLKLGRPQGYTKRQVQGWSQRYQKAKTDSIADVDLVGKWLSENIPPENQGTLIHNDFKFDNLVLAPDNKREVVGILDWEMATLGDPLMDLGTALSYWIQADDPALLHNFRFAPTHLDGMLSRTELAEAYNQATGRSIEHILFYYVFGLFKSVGIVQQIYYRYHQGLTSDPRFAQFIHAVRVLSAQAKLAIERGTIS